MIPEEGDAARRQEGERDTLAERRARRAWLGDAALLRRAEAAEASVLTLEAHLADLRRRQSESERMREHTTAQLAERELELRRVKQREYAEQQLRVEAEEVAVRARRGHRSERDRWQRRLEEAQAAAQYAEEQRDALAARLAAVNQSCERLRQGIVALQGVAVELRTTFEREGRSSQARIRELEGALERARSGPPPQQRTEAEEAQRREEMAGALAAAVTRLRTRVVVPTEQSPGEEGDTATGITQTPVQERSSSAVPTQESSTAGIRATPTWGRPPAEVQATAQEPLPTAAPTAPAQEGSSTAASATVSTTPGDSGPPEVATVIVVPRLFASRGRSARWVAPVVRRVARRLARWADRAQERPR